MILLVFISLIFFIFSFFTGMMSGSFFYIMNKRKSKIITKLIIVVNLFVILFLIYNLEFKIMISFIIGFLFGKKVIHRINVNNKNKIVNIDNMV